MCTIVDGYKLYYVYDKFGIAHEVAGFGNDDAVFRAGLRGIEEPQYAQWHEVYREYACEEDLIEKAVMRVQIKDRIYDDIAAYP